MSVTVAAADLMSHVLPHRIMEKPLIESFFGKPLYLTNHLLMTVVVAALMLLIFPYVASRVKTKGDGIDAYTTRGTLANFFETLCVFLREEVTRPALGHLTDRYIKYVWTTFFFVLFCNLLGMVPVGPILRFVGGNDPHLEHWGGTATGNIAITAGLALVSFFMIHAVGIRENGIRYFAHFNPGPWYMAPLLVPLEIVGSLVKPFALAVRLFANMVAGHLVLAALLGMIFTFKNYGVVVGSLIGCVAISLLELFVAFLQAYIFTFLTVLFIAAGAVHEHEEHEEGHHGEDAAGGHAPAAEH
ncbi:MAG: ATP synthase F0 subunit A [Phycisphaeraceae bacterium]|nr:ATP synthase F0 subunit A [Phycisphaeraceae bacterium]